jgi:hypothetical protein
MGQLSIYFPAGSMTHPDRRTQQRQALAKVYAVLIRLAEQNETASPVEPLAGSTGEAGNGASSNQEDAL